jgi:hypothetical protein
VVLACLFVCMTGYYTHYVVVCIARHNQKACMSLRLGVVFKQLLAAGCCSAVPGKPVLVMLRCAYACICMLLLCWLWAMQAACIESLSCTEGPCDTLGAPCWLHFNRRSEAALHHHHQRHSAAVRYSRLVAPSWQAPGVRSPHCQLVIPPLPECTPFDCSQYCLGSVYRIVPVSAGGACWPVLLSSVSFGDTTVQEFNAPCITMMINGVTFLCSWLLLVYCGCLTSVGPATAK